MLCRKPNATHKHTRKIMINWGWFITIKPIWLVVSTPLKNISQLGLLFPIYGKIKNVPNHNHNHPFIEFYWWSIGIFQGMNHWLGWIPHLWPRTRKVRLMRVPAIPPWGLRAEKNPGFFKGKSSETMGFSTLKYRGIRGSKPIQVSKFYPILAK